MSSRVLAPVAAGRVLRCGEAVEVLSELREDVRWHGDDTPSCSRLGGSYDPLAALQLEHGLVDDEEPGLEIDVRHFEGEDLPEPETAPGSQQDQIR